MIMKLIFGLLVGAVLVYLFEPTHGPEHREMLKGRLRRGKDVADHRDDIVQAGRDTAIEARERAQTVAGHAQERFGQTTAEARDQARELNDSARERARVAIDGHNN